MRQNKETTENQFGKKKLFECQSFKAKKHTATCFSSCKGRKRDNITTKEWMIHKLI